MWKEHDNYQNNNIIELHRQGSNTISRSGSEVTNAATDTFSYKIVGTSRRVQKFFLLGLKLSKN